MLRSLFLLVLLANAFVFAWRSSWLSPWLPLPSERKPEMMALQQHPERLSWPGDRPASAAAATASGASSASAAAPGEGSSAGAALPASAVRPGSAPVAGSPLPAASGTASGVTGASAAAAASGAARPAALSPSQPASQQAALARPGNLCLQGPWLDKEESAAFEKVLAQVLQKGQWQSASQQSGGAYHIYMGKYASQEQLERKEQELRRLGVSFEALRNSPGLEPGLSLGKYPREDLAEKALDVLERKGIRTAKVITITPAQVQWTHKMQGLSAEQAQQLRQRLGERNLRNCGAPAR